MRPRIFRSKTEMRAKSVRKTASSAAMLMRAEMICITQSDAPARGESKCCFARTKIWSITSVIVDEESGRTFFYQERTINSKGCDVFDAFLLWQQCPSAAVLLWFIA